MGLRVVVVSTDRVPTPPPRGGAIENYTYNIARHMSRLGHEVHLVGVENREADYSGVSFHDLGLGSGSARALKRVFEILSPDNANIPYLTYRIYRVLKAVEKSSGTPDVLYVHYFTTSFGPLLYSKSKGSPMVLHMHNEPKPNLINKYLAKNAKAIFAVSDFIRRRTAELLEVQQEKVFTVYNAVDTDAFTLCGASEKELWRERLGVAESEEVLGFIGRIVPEKGLHALAGAMKKLRERGLDLLLLVAGPKGHFDKTVPGYAEKVFAYMDRAGARYKYIGVVGGRSLMGFYCAIDALVVPSIGEDACPTAVLEALASGVFVVAFESGGIPELIPPRGGVLVPRGNINALADAIERFLEGTYHHDPLSARGFVAANFSYGSVAKKASEILERLASSG